MSVLRRSVFVGLVLFALIHLNDAACWMKKKREGPGPCRDVLDKIWHPVGSSWTNKRCDNCQCMADGMRCCDGFLRFPDIAKDCTVKYNYKTCTFKVFKKGDPSIPCFYSAVGK